MSTSLIVAIIVGVLLLIGAIIGYKRGFLRIIITTAALIVSIVLASVITTPVSTWLEDTFIGRTIEKSVEKYIDSKGGSYLSSAGSTAQKTIIEALPLPSFIKDNYAKNNNSAGYSAEGVTSFSEYIAKKITHTILSLIAFIALIILISIFIRIILRLIDLLTRVPVVHGINQLFGALIGIIEVLIIIWVAALIVMAIAQTALGIKILAVINDNSFLKFIYDKNMLIVAGKYIFKLF